MRDDSTIPRAPSTPTPDPCPACGTPTQEGSCTNPDCPEGFENLYWADADAQYHAAMDRELEDYWVEVDL